MSTATVNITEFLEQNPTVSGREAARRLNVHESAIRRAKMTKTETAKQSTLKTLKVKDLVLDPECQIRVEMNQEVIDDYADAMRSGEEFPAIDVFFDGAVYFVANGFHRARAALAAGIKTLEANVFEGDKRAAVLFALGANKKNGTRLTSADKRHAAATMLADPEWSKWSDRRIAEFCGAAHPLVAAVRRGLEREPAIPMDALEEGVVWKNLPHKSTRIRSDGRKFTVATKPKPPAPNGKHTEPTNGHVAAAVTITPRRERDPGDDDEETEVDGYIAEDVEGEVIPTGPQPSEEERYLQSLPLSSVLKGRALETFHRAASRFRKAREVVATMKALGLSAEPKTGEVLDSFTRAVIQIVRFQYPNAWGPCLTCDHRGDSGCKTCYGQGFVAK